jgi:hypothetical protein
MATLPMTPEEVAASYADAEGYEESEDHADAGNEG